MINLLLLLALAQDPKPCMSTTMDGLPTCPMPKMSSAECLMKFPPHQVGGFCNWYGYATTKEEDRFERKQGFSRLDPNNTLWVKAKRRWYHKLGDQVGEALGEWFMKR